MRIFTVVPQIDGVGGWLMLGQCRNAVSESGARLGRPNSEDRTQRARVIKRFGAVRIVCALITGLMLANGCIAFRPIRQR